MSFLLVRKEFFGCTLFDSSNCNRFHLNKEEYTIFCNTKTLPNDVFIDLDSKKIIFINNELDLCDNFSSPNIVFFEITDKCNLNCSYCLNDSNKNNSNFVSMEDFKMIIDELFLFGVQELRLTGGEPMLNPFIFEMIEYASNLGMYLSIGTNATILNEDSIRKMATIGLKKAVVSLDGLPEINSVSRSEYYTFYKILENISLFLKYNIKVKLNIVVSKINFKNIKDLLYLIEEKSLNVDIFLRRYISTGRGTNDFSITSDEYSWLCSDLSYFINRGLVKGHAILEEKKISRISLPFYVNSCSMGQTAIVIDSFLNLKLCGFLEEKLFNLRNKNISDMWIKINSNKKFKTHSEELIMEYNKKYNKNTFCYAEALYGGV